MPAPDRSLDPAMSSQTTSPTLDDLRQPQPACFAAATVSCLCRATCATRRSTSQHLAVQACGTFKSAAAVLAASTRPLRDDLRRVIDDVHLPRARLRRPHPSCNQRHRHPRGNPFARPGCTAASRLLHYTAARQVKTRRAGAGCPGAGDWRRDRPQIWFDNQIESGHHAFDHDRRYERPWTVTYH